MKKTFIKVTKKIIHHPEKKKEKIVVTCLI